MGRPCTEAALQSRTMEHFPPRRRRGQKSLCLRVLTQGGYSIAEQALVRWSCNAQQCVCVRSTSLSLTSSRTSLLLTLWTYPLLVLSFKASPYHLSSSSLKTFFFFFFLYEIEPYFVEQIFHNFSMVPRLPCLPELKIQRFPLNGCQPVWHLEAWWGSKKTLLVTMK